MVQTRRAFGEAVISVGALLALILMLAAFDSRVREQISLRVGGGRPSSAQLIDAGVTVRNLTGVVFTAVREQGIEHAPLVIFVLAATVLLLFMLRT